MLAISSNHVNSTSAYLRKLATKGRFPEVALTYESIICSEIFKKGCVLCNVLLYLEIFDLGGY